MDTKGPHTCDLPTSAWVPGSNFFTYLMGMGFFYVCTLHACLVLTEARKGHQLLWNWYYSQVWASMCSEPLFSGRAISAFKNWTISLQLHGDKFLTTTRAILHLLHVRVLCGQSLPLPRNRGHQHMTEYVKIKGHIITGASATSIKCGEDSTQAGPNRNLTGSDMNQLTW